MYFTALTAVLIILGICIGLFLYRKLSLANRETKESETLYRAVKNGSTEGILLVDAATGMIREANRGMELMLGYGNGELSGKHLSAIAADAAQTLDDLTLNASDKKHARATERLFLHKNGNTVETEVGSTAVRCKGIQIACLSVRDITDRKLAEKALRSTKEELEMWVEVRTGELSEANARLQSDIEERKRVESALRNEENIRRMIFNAIPEMITVIDRNFRIVHSNWGGGYDYVPEKIRGSNPYCYDAFYPSQGARCEPCHAYEAFTSGRTVCREKINPRIGQVEIHAYPIFDETGQVVMVIEHIRDITERKKLEEERLKSQKLESVGVLAGGIAHDFNNLLTSVLGNIYLAKNLAEPGSKLVKRLEDAEKASKRAATLTQQLLTFSRGGEPVRKYASIQQLVRDSVSFVLRGSNASCEFSFPDDIWPVHVDCGQISHAINNLIMNAVQAMPDGGRIVVATENMIIGHEDQKELSPGRYVKVSVQDQGSGIAAADLGKIFDPYFTTRPKGSGLGLSTVFSIIKKHGGAITVDSRPGEGTTFHFFLPCSEEEPIATANETVSPDSVQGNVLVMDDEEIIREVAGEILSHLGYRVEYCADGAEAIEKYLAAGKAGKPFDVILMDLTIPGGMGGKETMKRLMEIAPQAKGIVSSGYSNDPILANYQQYSFSGVVMKPYSMEELDRTLHQVINSPSRPESERTH